MTQRTPFDRKPNPDLGPAGPSAVTREKALAMREALFQRGLQIAEEQRAANTEPTPRAFFGIFQNCGQYYTQAATWYSAASNAFDAGQLKLGYLYMKYGNEASAKGDDCMSFW